MFDDVYNRFMTEENSVEDPRSTEQELTNLGLAPEVQRDITNFTNEARVVSVEDFPSIAVEIAEHSGNYQRRIEEDSRIKNVKVVRSVPTPPSTEGYFRRRIVHHPPAERTLRIKAGNIVEEIGRYAGSLKELGQESVSVVDFGAGRALTMFEVAHAFPEKIDSGELDLTATNLERQIKFGDRATIMLAAQEEGSYSHGHISKITREAILGKKINFEAANLIELYQRRRDNPIDLLFMVDLLPRTFGQEEAYLSVAAALLDPHHGTLILRLPTRTDDDSSKPNILAGLNRLEEKGFTRRIPILGTKDDDRVHGWPSKGTEGFEVYQAPQAPPFPLFEVSD